MIEIYSMDIKTYLDNIDNVEGWCIPYLWNCIQPLDLFQKKMGVTGPIAEIGVYHGKFFCGLALTKKNEGRHLAIDIFEDQELNMDIEYQNPEKFNTNGVGKEIISNFKSNLTKYGINETEILQKDSLTLTNKFIQDKEQNYSMVSVDGCHLALHTAHDFKLAMKLAMPSGIIFIDDYHSHFWPEVQEGISKVFFYESPTYVPLLFYLQ